MINETREYLTAYEQCTVPFQRHFNSHAELDAEIVLQLTRKHFPLAVEPNIQAKLDKLVERIRNTWVKKYNLTFGNRVVNGGTLQPTSLTWKAPGYENASVRGVKRNAAGDVVRAADPANRAPSNAPTGPAGYLLPAFSSRDESAFTDRRPETQAHASRDGRVAANGEAVFQPLVISDNDPQLAAYFSHYESINRIRTPDMREKVQRLLEIVPDESVARCMQALWCRNSDVDEAHHWLTAHQDMQVIEISDVEEDDHGNSLEHARETHKIGNSPHQVNSRLLTKKQRQRQSRMNKRLGYGTLQKPSKKAKANLRKSPEYTPFRNDNLDAQPLVSQPNDPFAQSSIVPDYISLVDDAPAPAVRRSKRLKLQAEIVDLTTEGHHGLEPTDRAPGLVSSVPSIHTVQNNLSHVFVNHEPPAINSTKAADGTSQGLITGQPEKLQGIASAAHDKCVNAEQDVQRRPQQSKQTDAEQQEQHGVDQNTDSNAGCTTASLMRSLVQSMRHASVSLQQSSQEEQTLTDLSTKASGRVHNNPPQEGVTTSGCADDGEPELVGKGNTYEHASMPVIVDGRTPEQRLREPLAEIPRPFFSKSLVPVISLDAIGAGFGTVVHLAKKHFADGTKSADGEHKVPTSARDVASTVPSKLSVQLEKLPAPIREAQDTTDQVSELEEGEILEDDAAAAGARRSPGATVEGTRKHQTSDNQLTCAMPALSHSKQIDFSVGALSKSLRENGQFGREKDSA